jgi:hypothetical protein
MFVVDIYICEEVRGLRPPNQAREVQAAYATRHLPDTGA